MVEVEVVDAHLDYKLLLGRSWTYPMCSISSVVLRVVVFPHEGNLVTVDQLNFTQRVRLETNESTIKPTGKTNYGEVGGWNVFIVNGHI